MSQEDNKSDEDNAPNQIEEEKKEEGIKNLLMKDEKRDANPQAGFTFRARSQPNSVRKILRSFSATGCSSGSEGYNSSQQDEDRDRII